ncbi:hypothetical protein GCM10022243_43230 [Saccharothrix violaceirubra]|uniref:Uncharacterized protein n=1 Tax=Saccharothrix violaceirubra TaxID=413306 RepID=A0A7W7WW03_9PSEU|nr:hypothetical protein [Saccharothrix violaceirubra]MBB4965611.1 hypothetical protein [Saccharothrix violaceirubra]
MPPTTSRALVLLLGVLLALDAFGTHEHAFQAHHPAVEALDGQRAPGHEGDPHRSPVRVEAAPAKAVSDRGPAPSATPATCASPRIATRPTHPPAPVPGIAPVTDLLTLFCVSRR